MATSVSFRDIFSEGYSAEEHAENVNKKQIQGHLATAYTLNGHLASADVHTEECAECTDTTLSLGTGHLQWLIPHLGGGGSKIY